MKVTILGRNSWVGGYFAKFYNTKVSDIDVLDENKLLFYLMNERPDVVINCVGKTGRPNIDWCNNNKYETYKSNVLAPLVIQEVCNLLNIKLVHLSTGCLWKTGENKNENDIPEPCSFYSGTKVEGEYFINKDNLIIRLRMPFDGKSNDRCIIAKIKKYNYVLDGVNSMVYVPDLIRAVNHLIVNNHKGIFNVVNKGGVSPVFIKRLFNEPFEIVNNDELLTLGIIKENRSTCTLDISRLESTGFDMPDIFDRLNNMNKQEVCNE